MCLRPGASLSENWPFLIGSVFPSLLPSAGVKVIIPFSSGTPSMLTWPVTVVSLLPQPPSANRNGTSSARERIRSVVIRRTSESLGADRRCAWSGNHERWPTSRGGQRSYYRGTEDGHGSPPLRGGKT